MVMVNIKFSKPGRPSLDIKEKLALSLKDPIKEWFL